VRTGIFLIIALFVLSCSWQNDEVVALNFSATDRPQEWELYQMTDNTGKALRGENMPWRENYIFQSDSVFVKSRRTEEGVVSGAGTFKIEIVNYETGILLTYPEASGIIGTCGEEKQEYLNLSSDKITLVSSWWACDGPGLFYRRTK
jgi:hypothetical protein